VSRPRVALLGLSHRTAGLAVRERLAIPATRVGPLYGELKRAFPSTEALLLGTCNRVELYVAAEPLPAREGLLGFLASFQGLEPAVLAPHAYGLEGPEAVRHCFSVASGLEALALGETQVLGQAKEAYGVAQEHGMLGPVLHALFQQAFATAKRVHSETTVGQGKVSVGSVAAQLAGRIFQDLSGHGVLVIGAGEMGELAATHLAEAGGNLLVVNRTFAKAEALARDRGGKAFRLEDLGEALAQADIVVSSAPASADSFLLTSRLVQDAQRRRRRRPLFLIDLAVPRSIHPEVRDLENVYAYDLDDLEKVARENLKGRSEELDACRAIVEEQVAGFLKDRSERHDLQPLITALRAKIQGMREQEVARFPLEARAAAEEATHRLVNKILHDPLEALKTEGPEAVDLLRRLFKL